MTADLKPYSLILVSVMPSLRDMEIARLLGLYRIPFRSAPKVVDVDFLAFYQPSIFPAPEGGRINYLAPVRGHELTTRRELLRDEPNHPRASEEYYKIQIGPLTPLDTPIEADQWKRVTFLYTTGEYLVQARTIHDLVVHSEERARLWQSLRDRAMNSNGEYSDPAEAELDPQITEWLGYLYLAARNE
jgi:hypothetical protein